MRCKHCRGAIVKGALGWVHEHGWYACVTVPVLDKHYAEPEEEGVDDVEAKKISGAPAGVVDESKCVGCGSRQVSNCENCYVPLCVDCDSGQYVDVMVCRDAEACELRLRRQAVANSMRSLFQDEVHN